MAYRLQFAPGPEQAVHAGHYFNTLANDLVDGTLTGMHPNHYRIGPGVPPSCVLRLWSYGRPVDEIVLNILALAAVLQRDTATLLRAKDRETMVVDFFERWLGSHWAEHTFFLEKLKARDAFTQNERLDLSLAVLDGRLAMLSTGTFMFVQHAPGLFGLAISGHGSYLVEELRAEPAPVMVRR